MTTISQLTGMIADELSLRNATDFTIAQIRQRVEEQVSYHEEEVRRNTNWFPHLPLTDGPLDCPRSWSMIMAATMDRRRQQDRKAEQDRRKMIMDNAGWQLRRRSERFC